jgi:hypothetical protein
LVVTNHNACPWQLGLIVVDRTPEATKRCADAKSDFYGRVLEELNPEVLVLVETGASDPLNYWTNWAYEGQLDGTYSEQLAAVEATSRSTVADLAGRFDGKIVIFEPIPLSKVDAVECLGGAIASSSDCDFVPTPSPTPEDRIVRALAKENDRVIPIDNDALTCPGKTLCAAVIDGMIVRLDESHLTTDFLDSIAPQIDAGLQAAGVFSAPG